MGNLKVSHTQESRRTKLYRDFCKMRSNNYGATLRTAILFESRADIPQNKTETSGKAKQHLLFLDLLNVM